MGPFMTGPFMGPGYIGRKIPALTGLNNVRIIMIRWLPSILSLGSGDGIPVLASKNEVCQKWQNLFSGPHFRLPRFDLPLTTPSEVKINGRRILPVINYYIKTLYSLTVYTQVYTLLSKILFICRNKIVLWVFT